MPDIKNTFVYRSPDTEHVMFRSSLDKDFECLTCLTVGDDHTEIVESLRIDQIITVARKGEHMSIGLSGRYAR